MSIISTTYYVHLIHPIAYHEQPSKINTLFQQFNLYIYIYISQNNTQKYQQQSSNYQMPYKLQKLWILETILKALASTLNQVVKYFSHSTEQLH